MDVRRDDSGHNIFDFHLAWGIMCSVKALRVGRRHIADAVGDRAYDEEVSGPSNRKSEERRVPSVWLDVASCGR